MLTVRRICLKPTLSVAALQGHCLSFSKSKLINPVLVWGLNQSIPPLSILKLSFPVAILYSN